jgi:hypothetical protein
LEFVKDLFSWLRVLALYYVLLRQNCLQEILEREEIETNLKRKEGLVLL